jgi:hypothetical protein
MELFKRNPFVRTETVETTTEPVFTPVEASDSEQSPRNWPMVAALAIAALAFAVLVAVSATWLYNKVSGPDTPSNTVQSLPKPPPQNLAPEAP